MRSYDNYQSIPDEEEDEFEREVEIQFEKLCDYYADEIAEKGMNAQQKASLMRRARNNARIILTARR